MFMEDTPLVHHKGSRNSTVDARDSLADGPEPCCVICLETVADPCEVRPCQHRNFDYLCLLSWIERVSVCPLCKEPVREVADHTNYVYRVPGRDALHPPPPSRPSQVTSTPQPCRSEAVLRRQRIYRNHLFSLHVGSNPRSRYREITPARFKAEPELLSRARAWLRRELQVFEFLHNPGIVETTRQGHLAASSRSANPEFLLEYIVAVLKTFDIQGSQGAAQDQLAGYLGRENAILLLHELRNFLRSPFSIDGWDRNVQYPFSNAPQPRSRRYKTAPHNPGLAHRRHAQPDVSPDTPP